MVHPQSSPKIGFGQKDPGFERFISRLSSSQILSSQVQVFSENHQLKKNETAGRGASKGTLRIRLTPLKFRVYLI